MVDHAAPYRVLIVDDAPAVREALRWLLENEPDIEVIGEASNGFEALTQASALLPDVVILDVEMPVMNGFEVARSLKSVLEPPGILFISVHDEPEFRESGLDAGGDGFVEKGAGWPVLISELRRILKLD